MREAGLHFLFRRRQRDPHLQAVDRLAVDAPLRPRALGMHDAAAGGHPVDFARPDRHRGAETVAVHDLAVEQIGDGGKPDMRMRPHVEPVAGAEFRRSEMIEEDERADHARSRGRQRAAHREVAEIDRARHDHLSDRVALIVHRRRSGSLPGKKLMTRSYSISLARASEQPQRVAAWRSGAPARREAARAIRDIP